MKMPQRRFRPVTHWRYSPPFHAALLIGALLAGPANAAPGDKIEVLRDLATRVGAVVGSALTCKDIARPRVQTVVDKFTSVIREASTNEAERNDLTQALDRGVTEDARQWPSARPIAGRPTGSSPIWNGRLPARACRP